MALSIDKSTPLVRRLLQLFLDAEGTAYLDGWAGGYPLDYFTPEEHKLLLQMEVEIKTG